MSAANPDITANDIISDVEERLSNPNIGADIYVPWVSYAYQRTFQALLKCDRDVRETLFGDDVTFNLTAGILEYSLATHIPRFGGDIKVEVKYGGTGDDWHRATKLKSVAHWNIHNNVSITYRGKDNPLYYILGGVIGFIPTPPSTDSGTPQAKVFYVKRPYQITDGTDIIDIPYRFIYPVVNYVQSKAIQKENEDYQASLDLESRFSRELELIAEAAASEMNENEGDGIEVSANSPLFDNPFR